VVIVGRIFSVKIPFAIRLAKKLGVDRRLFTVQNRFAKNCYAAS